MSSRFDFYFRQLVTEAELDAAFAALELAEQRIQSDNGIVGIVSGGSVNEHTPNNLTMDVAQGIAYDSSGQRISWTGTQVVDVSVDTGGSPTDVVGVGNSKIISIFASFTRSLTDPRTDGNGDSVFYNRAESFSFVIRQGAEAVSPVAPGLESDKVLLADITRAYGATQLTNANISTTRRQEAFSCSASGVASVSAGTPEEAIQAVLNVISAHVVDTTDAHLATAIGYAGGGNWADATTNPAATLEAQLDKIITDLTSTSGERGAGKLTLKALGNWADGTTNPATTLSLGVAKIITDLASAGGLNKLGPLTGTGEILYSAARTRKIRVALDTFQVTGGTVVFTPGIPGAADQTWSLQSNSVRLTGSLNPYLRDGQVITNIRLVALPGAARATAGNRIQIQLYTFIADFGTPGNNPVATTSVALECDDGNAAKQVFAQLAATNNGGGTSLGAGHTVVREGTNAREYWLTIKAGNTAGANNDTIYAVELTVSDPGPRNY